MDMFDEEFKPRRPTDQEKDELVRYFVDNEGWPEDNTNQSVQGAYIAVFDRYTTDSPGFSGKLMSVVWSGSPTMYDVFVWDHGRIVKQDREWD